MLKYKFALMTLGALYYRLSVFIVVGVIYCSVQLARYFKASYMGQFKERTL